MRRMVLSFLALSFLGAFIGCRQVGGVCDCYGYGCYPSCYSMCSPGCGSCGSQGPAMASPGTDHLKIMPPANTGPGPEPVPLPKGEPSKKGL